MYILKPFSVKDILWIKNNITSEKECRLWSGNMFEYPFNETQLNKYASEDSFSKIFSLYDTERRCIIGHIKVGEICEKINSATIQNVLIDKNSRGKGVGTFMLLSACRHVFENYNINVIRLRVKSENTGAIKCYRKLGFIHLDDSKKNESIRMFLTRNKFRTNLFEFESPFFKEIDSLEWFKDNRDKFKREQLAETDIKNVSEFRNIIIRNSGYSECVFSKIVVSAYFAYFIQKKYPSITKFIVEIENYRYFCLSKGQSFFAIYSELLSVVKNKIFVPENIEYYNNNIVNIYTSSYLLISKRDILLSIKEDNIVCFCEYQNFDDYIEQIEKEISQCFKILSVTSELGLLLDFDLVVELITTKRAISINDCLYDGEKIIEDLYKCLYFFNDNGVCGYKVCVEIEDTYRYIVLILALFLSNNDLAYDDVELFISSIMKAENVFQINDIDKIFDTEPSKDFKNLFHPKIKSKSYDNFLERIFFCSPTDEFDFITDIVLKNCVHVEPKKQKIKEKSKYDLKFVLKEAFKEILKKDVNNKSNFFVEGGNSLNAMQLILNLEKNGVMLSVNDIYNMPTINELANYVEGKEC